MLDVIRAPDLLSIRINSLRVVSHGELMCGLLNNFATPRSKIRSATAFNVIDSGKNLNFSRSK